ncbi:hypothetical protein C3743_15410 [Burkholderia contaminans]|uniref:Uncharacterized protein n=1 Tax=Burkholderia contaminans TaxID=488447 RepID=A0A2S5DRL0_9BURK|nr:hypothetical protein C3743_15410 [Burkholderia contaminans]
MIVLPEESVYVTGAETIVSQMRFDLASYRTCRYFPVPQIAASPRPSRMIGFVFGTVIAESCHVSFFVSVFGT